MRHAAAPALLVMVTLAVVVINMHTFGGTVSDDAASLSPARQKLSFVQTPFQSPPLPAAKCGDGRCDPTEDIVTCESDCPGVTTPAQCGEEPHADPAGEAVAWGSAPEHRVQSAAECCNRCAKHAADPKNAKKPCNSWVFCYKPHCWSLDSGNTHTFGWSSCEHIPPLSFPLHLAFLINSKHA